MLVLGNKLIKSNKKFYATITRCLATNSSCKNVTLLASAYKPHIVEKDKIAKWESNKRPRYYNPKKFTVLLPPPNVTGDLHLGHALTCTVQDVICRWKRKKDFDVIWVPGTDHAGIATQVVVEKLLKNERNMTRHNLGRYQFVKEVLKWKDEKTESIRADLKKMGTTLNWEQEYFTMDALQSDAVTNVFIELFEKGLIYRGESIINWSCDLESAISDIEVDSIEVKGPTSIAVPGYSNNVVFGQIYDIAYKIYENGEISKDEIIVSTTRPETLIGDVAVAINPSDSRYAYLQKEGKKELWHPIRKEKIPIIFDESVDINFGTGAVKITPAHDKNDYDMAKRHALPIVNVINTKGLISPNFDDYSSMPRFLAREKILNNLDKLNLLRGIKPHNMNLPVCSRSKDIIEFLIRPQWFMRCNDMAHEAVKAVESGELKIIPKTYESEWYRWLYNCRDWCISRQLWWGHQIPAYKCTYHMSTNKDFLWVAAQSLAEAKEKAMKHFNIKDESLLKLERDEDVLDTWFSSSLLPFSILGRLNTSYYPLSLMETGHDIMFFWVARMVMLGKQITGKLPFNQILLHSIICDANGRKMSKSVGNVISPDHIIKGVSLEELHSQAEKSYSKGILSGDELKKSKEGQSKMFPKGIPECGTDALRFSLCSYNIKNHFINFDINECYANKLFFNKIWQSARFTLMATNKFNFTKNDLAINRSTASVMDNWILSRLASTIRIVELTMDDYNFHQATHALKNFFYYNLCDVYLETTKANINKDSSSEEARNNCAVLVTCLSHGLNYMEMFTPFLVDELKSFIPQIPEFDLNSFLNPHLEVEIESCLEICAGIRQLKSQHNITKVHAPEVVLHIVDDYDYKVFRKHIDNICILTSCKNVKLTSSEAEFLKYNFIVKSTAGHNCTFGILTNEQYSTKNDSQRGDLNEKKLLKLEHDLEKMLIVVSNDGYKKSANENVQKKHSERIDYLKREIDNIKKIRISSRN